MEFAERDGKLYANTRNDSWKVRRIQDNSNAKIAPCTIRVKLLGEKMDITVRILSINEDVNIATGPRREN